MDIEIVEQALHRAEQVLDTAYFGLRILKGKDASQRSAGLRNVLVFGRSVTFVIQNLRTIVAEGAFDAWYAPHQAEMKADPLMVYFVEVRNNLEKQGRLSVSSSFQIKSCNRRDLEKFEQPPLDAQSFFLSDTIGGSGWEMDLGNGESIGYYVEVPSSIAESKQFFFDMADSVPREIREASVESLCEMYLGKISDVLTSAKLEFLPPERKRPTLRLV